MAHSPAFRPDPFEPDDAGVNRQNPDPFLNESFGGTLSHYVQVLSASGAEGISADLAVDLVLNDVLQRACAATGASAAAIALNRDGEMICRAATGEMAPDLGVALETTHGLSGECVRTGERQCCSDTECDARVDSAACQRLGVRSIVVVPIKKQQELIGIVEIFSPDANRFKDYEANILEGFAREITGNLDRPDGTQPSEASATAVVGPSEGDEVESPPEAVEPQAEKQAAPSDPWTSILLICVILLAGCLGWVVGWSKWHRGTIRAASATQVVQKVSIPENAPSEAGTEANASGAVAQAVHPSAPTARAESKLKAGDGLVVYQNGKIVFPPARRDEDRKASPNIKPGSDGELPLAPEIAKQYVAERVEPQYPESARSQGIQGSVMVGIIVGKNGSVRTLTPINGNPELMPAAMQAIAQWRFHPFFYQGEPHDFSTTVTVIFRLADK